MVPRAGGTPGLAWSSGGCARARAAVCSEGRPPMARTSTSRGPCQQPGHPSDGHGKHRVNVFPLCGKRSFTATPRTLTVLPSDRHTLLLLLWDSGEQSDPWSRTRTTVVLSGPIPWRWLSAACRYGHVCRAHCGHPCSGAGGSVLLGRPQESLCSVDIDVCPCRLRAAHFLLFC